MTVEFLIQLIKDLPEDEKIVKTSEECLNEKNYPFMYGYLLSAVKNLKSMVTK